MENRERLGSRLGFIMLSAGCAIGCGNVWKFPWMCGQYGGGSFMLVYLICLVLLGLPALVMEFSAGRAAQCSPIHMYTKLGKPGTKWGLWGYIALLGNIALMAFYCVVTGWIIYYFCRFATGSIDTLGYTMHVDYRHDHGFTEIANMSGTLLKDKVMLRFLLFGLGDRPMSFARAKRVGDNMLSAIDEVGYDSLLWTTSDIVKRTRVEERVAFGDSAFIRGERSAYNVPPSLQERDANAFLRDAMQKLKAGTMKLHRGLPTRK